MITNCKLCRTIKNLHQPSFFIYCDSSIQFICKLCYQTISLWHQKTKQLLQIKHLTHWGWKKIRRFFPDTIFKWIFLNENVWIWIKISLKFVPKDPINSIASLVQIMAWDQVGDKPWSKPMMVSVLTHIYVTRPQWIKGRGSLAPHNLIYCINHCE